MKYSLTSLHQIQLFDFLLFIPVFHLLFPNSSLTQVCLCLSIPYIFRSSFFPSYSLIYICHPGIRHSRYMIQPYQLSNSYDLTSLLFPKQSFYLLYIFGSCFLITSRLRFSVPISPEYFSFPNVNFIFLRFTQYPCFTVKRYCLFAFFANIASVMFSSSSPLSSIIIIVPKQVQLLTYSSASIICLFSSIVIMFLRFMFVRCCFIYFDFSLINLRLYIDKITISHAYASNYCVVFVFNVPVLLIPLIIHVVDIIKMA